MSDYRPHMQGHPQRPEDDIDFPGSRVRVIRDVSGIKLRIQLKSSKRAVLGTLNP